MRQSDSQTSDNQTGPSGLRWAAFKIKRPPLLIKPYNRALGAKEQKTAAFGSSPPLWCLTAPPFPRYSVGRQKESAFMGRLGALLRPTCTSYAGCAQWDYGYCAMCHISLQVSIEEISPTGEDAAIGGRRGAFPTGEARFCGFPFDPWGGCEGFIIRGAYLMSRRPPSC